MHTHKYTDTLRSLQRPLGLKKRCGAWLFAQGLYGMREGDTGEVLFSH